MRRNTAIARTYMHSQRKLRDKAKRGSQTNRQNVTGTQTDRGTQRQPNRPVYFVVNGGDGVILTVLPPLPLPPLPLLLRFLLCFLLLHFILLYFLLLRFLLPLPPPPLLPQLPPLPHPPLLILSVLVSLSCNLRTDRRKRKFLSASEEIQSFEPVRRYISK